MGVGDNYTNFSVWLELQRRNEEGGDRAINRMQRALEEIILEGPKTTIPFHQAIMRDETFQDGDFNTGFIDTFSYT